MSVLESTVTLYRDREINMSVNDLHSTTTLVESLTLQNFDTRVDILFLLKGHCSTSKQITPIHVYTNENKKNTELVLCR